MSWQNKSDLAEWLQEPVTMDLKRRLEESRQTALRRLLALAKDRPLDEIRAAAQRVLDTDEFLRYFEMEDE